MITRRRKSARRPLPGPPPLPDAVQSLVDNAMRRHENGDFAQAEQMYLEAARQAPGHPHIHHLLGVVMHQQNRNAEARVEIEAAIAALEPMPHYHNSLGEVLRALGDLNGAIVCFRRALELQADYLQALNNLALALHTDGDNSAARDIFAQIVSAQPDVAQAHNNLGIAEQSLGNLDSAIRSFRKACELAPQFAESWNNLGAALQEQGSSAAAAHALERAISVAPQLSRAHYNLSRLRMGLNDAVAAETSVRRAIEIEPREPQYYVHLGFVLRALERFDESNAVLRESLQRAPGHPVANNDIAVTLMMHGEFEQAERHLLAAIDSAPELSAAYENLARVRRFGPGDAPLMRRVETIAQGANISTQDRAHLHFALGKMWDDRADAERAFGHFKAANQAARQMTHWDADARSAVVDQIIATFDRDWFDDERMRAGYGDPSLAPLLIVGMPRSGTTLVEQILASHSQVIAHGELDFFANLADMMPRQLNTPDKAGKGPAPYPRCALQLRSEDMHAIARSYLRQFFSDPGGARHFTDKNPLNFDHLGLAAVMFPNVKFVHVSREAMATCWSIYSTHFSRDVGFAYELQEIARFYRDYERLMAHWRACLGERIVTVPYEALVSEQERSTRDLLDALGLEWQASCLQFHRTERMVGTASHWQVRQPLYAGAVSNWRRYEPWLNELAVALEQ